MRIIAGGPLKCPLCESESVVRSHRRGIWERILGIVRVYPFRCESCEHRFRAFSLGRQYVKRTVDSQE